MVLGASESDRNWSKEDIVHMYNEVDIKVGQVFAENKRIRGWEVLDKIPLRGIQNRIPLRGKLTFVE